MKRSNATRPTDVKGNCETNSARTERSIRSHSGAAGDRRWYSVTSSRAGGHLWSRGKRRRDSGMRTLARGLGGRPGGHPACAWDSRFGTGLASSSLRACSCCSGNCARQDRRPRHRGAGPGGLILAFRLGASLIRDVACSTASFVVWWDCRCRRARAGGRRWTVVQLELAQFLESHASVPLDSPGGKGSASLYEWGFTQILVAVLEAAFPTSIVPLHGPSSSWRLPWSA